MTIINNDPCGSMRRPNMQNATTNYGINPLGHLVAPTITCQKRRDLLHGAVSLMALAANNVVES